MSEISHGTLAGYTGKHKCRCARCRAAKAAWQREYRKRLMANPIPARVKHGTLSTYVNYGCTCAECRAANNEYARRRKRERGNETS